MNDTIYDVVKNDLCTGCGTCTSLCPNGSIRMIIDRKKGIYTFQVDKDKCTNCGICHKVCPGHEVDFKTLNLQIFGEEPKNELIGNYLNCYIGNSNDNDIRYNSSSGGLITSILIYALEKGIIDGALVTRMKKDKPLEPEPFIARTKEDIIDASKSKYCPVPANIAIKEIIKAKDYERFAIVGLPCHIQGMRKAQMTNDKLRDMIVLSLGMFCAHTDSFLATQSILDKLGIDNKNVRKIEYRGRGWPGSMLIESDNGSVKTIPYKKYIKLFHSYNFFTPRRCLLCNDATCELADISFGDAWDLPELKNPEGCSIMISRTGNGEQILKAMNKDNKIELSGTCSKNMIISQRGLIYTKKIGFRFRSSVLGLIGKRLPNFDGTNLSNNVCFVPFDTMLPYLNTYVSSNNQALKLFMSIPSKILYCYGSISNMMAYLWLQSWLYRQINTWKNR